MKTDNQKMRDMLSAWWDNVRGKLPVTWGGRRCWVQKYPYSRGWWSQFEGERCIGIRISVGSAFYDGPMADMNLIITDSGRYFVYEKEHPGGLTELTNMVAKIFLANIPKALPEHPPLKLNEFYFIVPLDSAPLHVAVKPVDVCLQNCRGMETTCSIACVSPVLISTTIFPIGRRTVSGSSKSPHPNPLRNACNERRYSD